jgi:TolB-like protein/DNA-binding winged helix-turn-helix (wHTH) protein/Tfp pilus assembly protein PilF
MQSSPIIRFDQYELDLSSYELRKAGRAIRLEKIPMELLILLAERRGQLVTREEIIQRLWGESVFVDTRQGINTAIHKIRTALRDDPEHPRILQTIAGKGYRLISTSDTPAAQHPVGVPSSFGDTDQEVAGKSRRRAAWRNWQLPVAVLALLAAAAISAILARRFHVFRSSPPVGTVRSIAVLPLMNLSRDPEQEYFADGMTDELITDLAKISALRVISRTSVMRYKGATPPLRQIGKELNVDVVVEGSVLRAGDRVRITAQLVEASTDRHLWAERYERDFRDVLRLQEDVALDIAKQVHAKLTPQEQVRLAGAHGVNPDAYELYLKGRYHWARRGTGHGLTKAVEYFERAISVDPNYALAYAGAAQSYGMLGNNQVLPSHQVYPKAKAAALKALQLDPDLSDAHTALAEVLNDYEWNWPAAEQEYKRAIELNPNDPTAHHWYAVSLAWVGRSAEAIDEIQRALQLDPVAVNPHSNLALILLWARQYDRATVEAQEALELDANVITPHEVLALVFLQKRSYDRALAEFETAARMSPLPRMLAKLAYGYAMTGQSAKALSTLDKLKHLPTGTYCPATSMAIIYGALGQKDEAFALLNKGLTSRDGADLLAIKVHPFFDPLRSDPRFAEVLRRRGLPQ